jgi:hypothetical protein
MDKFGRILHAHISLGTTSDDRFLPSGYVKAFADMPNLVIQEKLDGQNQAFKKSGVYARSHAAPTEHPWDKPMRERWELMKNDLGDLEIFGENMFGIHSIAYKNLESYFYVFAVREKNRWLSLEEVKWYAEMFDFPTTPEIKTKISLKDFYEKNKKLDENKILSNWLIENLGMTWEEYVNTPGALGGYDPKTGKDACEGFVIKNVEECENRNSGVLETYDNEFNNLFKLVRKGHVKTDEHWTKTWKPATLTDYAKYNWHAYEYLENR